jgi:hypothetical protein
MVVGHNAPAIQAVPDTSCAVELSRRAKTTRSPKSSRAAPTGFAASPRYRCHGPVVAESCNNSIGSHWTPRWREMDSNFRFGDALSSPTALVEPPDSAVSGGSFNGVLQPQSVGGPAGLV